jgi:hypothetical protein
MRKPKNVFLAPPDGFPVGRVHPGELLKDELAAHPKQLVEKFHVDGPDVFHLSGSLASD